MDASIADKLVVAWLGGNADMCDYNGWADPWAAYILLEKLRSIQFPEFMAPPQVPKQRLLKLPGSPLRDFMYQKHHPTNSDPRNTDGDGPPAISLKCPDFPLTVKRVAFHRWA